MKYTNFEENPMSHFREKGNSLIKNVFQIEELKKKEEIGIIIFYFIYL